MTTVTVDRGWSWVILAASFGCSFLMFGTLSGGGVLYVAILDTFQNSTDSDAVWILFLMQICLNIMGPLAGYLGQRYSYKKIVIIGGSVASFGLFLCFFATSVIHLFAFFGLIYGLGLGLVVTPHIVVVNLVFEKYRALANGIFTTGASVGCFVIPLILEILTENFGLKGTFLIWSAVILNIVAFGSVYMQDKGEKAKVAKEVEVEVQFLQDNIKKISSVEIQEIHVAANRRKSRFSWLSFLADRHFWMVAFGWSGSTFGISCFAVIIVSFAIAQNEDISKTEATFFISIWAVGDLIGRLGCGWILDRKWVKLKNCYIFSMICASIAVTVVQFLSSYIPIAICAFCFGLSLGAAFIQHSLLLIATLGIETFQRAFGYLGITAGINLIGLTSLVGFLREQTQSHHCNFTLMGFMLMCPALLWAIEMFYDTLCKKHRDNLQLVNYDKVHDPK